LNAQALAPEEHFIREQPYYEPVGNEIAIFEAAYRHPEGTPGAPSGCSGSGLRHLRYNRLRRGW